MKLRAVELLKFGEIVTHGEVKEFNRKAPNGYFLVTDDDQIEFINNKTVIKGEIGKTFGIEYFLRGISNKVKLAYYTSKLIHPKMDNLISKKVEYEVVEKKYNYINRKNFDYFKFEYDWEILKGVWSFEIWERSRLFLKQDFTVE